MTDDQIETAIQAKGANVAPRVTIEDIEAAIQQEVYMLGTAAADALRLRWLTHDPKTDEDRMKQAEVIEHLPVLLYSGACAAIDGPAKVPELELALGRLTFCILILASGYTVVGHSACVSPENFDAELGRKIARQNAIDQCWPLFGFHLAACLAGM
jgi:hypothetical protein